MNSTSVNVFGVTICMPTSFINKDLNGLCPFLSILFFQKAVVSISEPTQTNKLNWDEFYILWLCNTNQDFCKGTRALSWFGQLPVLIMLEMLLKIRFSALRFCCGIGGCSTENSNSFSGDFGRRSRMSTWISTSLFFSSLSLFSAVICRSVFSFKELLLCTRSRLLFWSGSLGTFSSKYPSCTHAPSPAKCNSLKLGLSILRLGNTADALLVPLSIPVFEFPISSAPHGFSAISSHSSPSSPHSPSSSSSPSSSPLAGFGVPGHLMSILRHRLIIQFSGGYPVATRVVFRGTVRGCPFRQSGQLRKQWSLNGSYRLSYLAQNGKWAHLRLSKQYGSHGPMGHAMLNMIRTVNVVNRDCSHLWFYNASVLGVLMHWFLSQSLHVTFTFVLTSCSVCSPAQLSNVLPL